MLERYGPLLLIVTLAIALYVAWVRRPAKGEQFPAAPFAKRVAGTWIVSLVGAVVAFLIFCIVIGVMVFNDIGEAVKSLSGGCVNC
jgi:hypothetical protein